MLSLGSFLEYLLVGSRIVYAWHLNIQFKISRHFEELSRNFFVAIRSRISWHNPNHWLRRCHQHKQESWVTHLYQAIKPKAKINRSSFQNISSSLYSSFEVSSNKVLFLLKLKYCIHHTKVSNITKLLHKCSIGNNHQAQWNNMPTQRCDKISP